MLGFASLKGTLIKFSEKIQETTDKRFHFSQHEMVWAVICAIGNSIMHHQSINQLRLSVMELLKTRIARSTFWERIASKCFKEELQLIFQMIVESKIAQNTIFASIAKKMGIKTIYIVDSTVSSLPDSAKKEYPSVSGEASPASVKTHVLLDILNFCVNSINLTPGSFHDRHGIVKLAELVAGSLLIFDLGYQDYGLFAEIAMNGGFFLTRLKIDAVIFAIDSNFPEWIGKNILDIDVFLGSVIEFSGAFKIKGNAIAIYRVLGFWNMETKKYHWYCTNLQKNIAVTLIYDLYRVRWQIECFFKTLKGAIAMAKITSKNSNIIEVLIIAAMCSFMLAAEFSSTAIEEIKVNDEKDEEMKVSDLRNEEEEEKTKPDLSKKKKKISAQTLMRVMHGMKCFARELYNFLMQKSEDTWRELIKKISLYQDEFYDPNYKNRPTSMGRLYNHLCASEI